MSKYHISPTTGRANICRATKRGCPLGADAPHFESKEAARAGYEAQQKGSEVPPPAKRTSEPAAPPAPPVPTAIELRREEENLRDELYGYSVGDLLYTRGVGLAEIEEAEREGSYAVTAKVPSYYEVGISTDLARSVLGLPSRPQTSADHTPPRRAQVEFSEAQEACNGRMTLQEAIEAEARVKEARSKLRALEHAAWLAKARARVTVTDAEYVGGKFREVKNSKGLVLGNITFREGFYLAGHVEKKFTPAGGRVPRNVPVTLGHYGSEEEALDAILEAKRFQV